MMEPGYKLQGRAHWHARLVPFLTWSGEPLVGPNDRPSLLGRERGGHETGARRALVSARATAVTRGKAGQKTTDSRPRG